MVSYVHFVHFPSSSLAKSIPKITFKVRQCNSINGIWNGSLLAQIWFNCFATINHIARQHHELKSNRLDNIMHIRFSFSCIHFGSLPKLLHTWRYVWAAQQIASKQFNISKTKKDVMEMYFSACAHMRTWKTSKFKWHNKMMWNVLPRSRINVSSCHQKCSWAAHSTKKCGVYVLWPIENMCIMQVTLGVDAQVFLTIRAWTRVGFFDKHTNTPQPIFQWQTKYLYRRCVFHWLIPYGLFDHNLCCFFGKHRIRFKRRKKLGKCFSSLDAHSYDKMEYGLWSYICFFPLFLIYSINKFRHTETNFMELKTLG